MEFKYIAIISCLLLLAFLIYKEISRANKARLGWRIFANLVAVASFVLLIIPVKYEILSKQNANEIMLLTKGVNPDSILKLKGEKYVLASAGIKNIKATSIEDLPYFLATHPDVRKLNVYGYGLSEDDLKKLEGYEFNFYPAASPNGIISVNWKNKVKSTEKLIVQGTFQNTGNETVRLLLKGLGNTVDSIMIKAKSNQPFSFKNQPKQIGKAIYQLIALQGKDTLAKEPVPFIVAEEKPMKVLILASFPDFEYKFLKQWLFENQYPLAFRSQISKNKYSTDFLNIDNLSLDNINVNLLRKFDVLIVDEEELAALTTDERAAIDNAVNGGLGLFIRISGPKPLTLLSSAFGRFEVPVSKGKQLNLAIKDENYTFSKLPLGQTLFLRTSQNDQALVADLAGKVLVNSSIKGSGKILISSLGSTFNWLLSGKKNDYTTYWSEILSKAARKKFETQSVKITPQFPAVNEKARFIVDLSASGKIPVLKIDSLKLAPQQNIELPFEWDTVFWPAQNGWNNLNVNQSAESFFVYQKEDWQALKNQLTINFTLRFLGKSKNQGTKNSASAIILQEEVSIWWFLAGFLFASAFLWLESRVLDAK